jgi:hypothetical protein
MSGLFTGEPNSHQNFPDTHERFRTAGGSSGRAGLKGDGDRKGAAIDWAEKSSELASGRLIPVHSPFTIHKLERQGELLGLIAMSVRGHSARPVACPLEQNFHPWSPSLRPRVEFF